MEKKSKFCVIFRVLIGLIVWFLFTKGYGILIAPVVDSHISVLLGKIIASMVVPYTFGLGAFYLIVKTMPEVSLFPTGEKINLIKAFVIQSGLSFPLFFILNAVFTLIGLPAGGIAQEEISSNIIFYVVLLLVFNPVFEELLYRKLVLSRLRVLGDKVAIFICALLFALPHLISVGFPSLVYTFVLGLVWSYVTVKTGKLWPAIILHSLSNLYGSFFSLVMTRIPVTTVIFVLIVVVIMPAIAITLFAKNYKRIISIGN